jgi:hypothetical protein
VEVNVVNGSSGRLGGDAFGLASSDGAPFGD